MKMSWKSYCSPQEVKNMFESSNTNTSTGKSFKKENLQRHSEGHDAFPQQPPSRKIQVFSPSKHLSRRMEAPKENRPPSRSPIVLGGRRAQSIRNGNPIHAPQHQEIKPQPIIMNRSSSNHSFERPSNFKLLAAKENRMMPVEPRPLPAKKITINNHSYLLKEVLKREMKWVQATPLESQPSSEITSRQIETIIEKDEQAQELSRAKKEVSKGDEQKGEIQTRSDEKSTAQTKIQNREIPSQEENSQEQVHHSFIQDLNIKTAVQIESNDKVISQLKSSLDQMQEPIPQIMQTSSTGRFLVLNPILTDYLHQLNQELVSKAVDALKQNQILVIPSKSQEVYREAESKQSLEIAHEEDQKLEESLDKVNKPNVIAEEQDISCLKKKAKNTTSEIQNCSSIPLISRSDLRPKKVVETGYSLKLFDREGCEPPQNFGMSRLFPSLTIVNAQSSPLSFANGGQYQPTDVCYTPIQMLSPVLPVATWSFETPIPEDSNISNKTVSMIEEEGASSIIAAERTQEDFDSAQGEEKQMVLSSSRVDMGLKQGIAEGLQESEKKIRNSMQQ